MYFNLRILISYFDPYCDVSGRLLVSYPFSGRQFSLMVSELPSKTVMKSLFETQMIHSIVYLRIQGILGKDQLKNPTIVTISYIANLNGGYYFRRDMHSNITIRHYTKISNAISDKSVCRRSLTCVNIIFYSVIIAPRYYSMFLEKYISKIPTIPSIYLLYPTFNMYIYVMLHIYILVSSFYVQIFLLNYFIFISILIMNKK